MKLLPLMLAAALSTVALAAAPTKSIELERRTEKKEIVIPQQVTAVLGGKTVAIELTDGRGLDDPAIVGAQLERGKTLYEWKSKGPVVVAVGTMLEQTLRSWNLNPTGTADVRVALTLSKFRVNEISEMFGSAYKAEVELGSGATLVQGTAKVSGPDRRASLCNEALTSALEDALAKALTATTTVVAPAAAAPLFDELMKLKSGGVGDDVLVGYVRQHPPASPLTADDILKWKQNGLPDSVIRAAQEAK